MTIAVKTYDTREGHISKADEASCEATLHAWMSALNEHDSEKMDSCLRFPHARIAANTVVVYEAPGNNPMDLFTKLEVQEGWHHSAWTDIRLLQSSPNKAHYAVQYTRYREDSSVIGIFDSLYVFTQDDGAWKIQARSSFGP